MSDEISKEIAALEKMVEVLKEFDSKTQHRMIVYVEDRFITHPPLHED